MNLLIGNLDRDKAGVVVLNTLCVFIFEKTVVALDRLAAAFL